jgi:hypothetical protein
VAMNSRTQEGATGRIYWIGGSKGGVGKSMLALATVDYLLSAGREVLLIECDNANPDVFRAYQDRVPTERTDLDEGDGWIHLVNVCDAHRDRAIVVNTAARNNVAVTRYGTTLDSSLEALDATLVALWVINRQRDSLELLKEFIEAIPRAERARGAQRLLRRRTQVRALQRVEAASLDRKSRGSVGDVARSRRPGRRRSLHATAVARRGGEVAADRQPSRARTLARRGPQGARRGGGLNADGTCS